MTFEVQEDAPLFISRNGSGPDVLHQVGTTTERSPSKPGLLQGLQQVAGIVINRLKDLLVEPIYPSFFVARSAFKRFPTLWGKLVDENRFTYNLFKIKVQKFFKE